jgi:hypothetical protein
MNPLAASRRERVRQSVAFGTNPLLTAKSAGDSEGTINPLLAVKSPSSTHGSSGGHGVPAILQRSTIDVTIGAAPSETTGDATLPGMVGAHVSSAARARLGIHSATSLGHSQLKAAARVSATLSSSDNSSDSVVVGTQEGGEGGDVVSPKQRLAARKQIRLIGQSPLLAVSGAASDAAAQTAVEGNSDRPSPKKLAASRLKASSGLQRGASVRKVNAVKTGAGLWTESDVSGDLLGGQRLVTAKFSHENPLAAKLRKGK